MPLELAPQKGKKGPSNSEKKKPGYIYAGKLVAKVLVLFVVTVAVLSGVKYILIIRGLDIPFLLVPILAGIILVIVWVALEKSAARADEVKYKFLTVAAHRIRTPLTRATWSTESLKTEIASEDGQQLLGNITETIKELTEISNHLLDASEAEHGSLYYDYLFEKGSLGTVARQIAADYGPGVAQKQLILSLDITETPQVIMDKERIRMAGGALLENAIIYTPVGGTIRLRVYTSGDSAVFLVSDSGIGIPTSEQKYLFTEFFRSKEATALDRDRAGLGLSIAKEVVEAHGGEIHASSEGKDRGSTFWFTLPPAPK